MIRAILALGAGLGLRTVTEGVEDPDTASMLTALGFGSRAGLLLRPSDGAPRRLERHWSACDSDAARRR